MTPDALGLFGLLPSNIFSEKILADMSPETLGTTAACSKGVRAAATSDILWARHWQEAGWGHITQDTSVFRAYSVRRQTSCVECRRPTRYVFKILGCRLCEKCEADNLSYSLVTACEAMERYGLSGEQLNQLAYLFTCKRKMFLRSSVCAMSASSSTSPSRFPEEPLGSSGEEVEECSTRALSPDDVLQPPVSEDPVEPEEHDQRKGKNKVDKEARKAWKKKVKAEQRLRRESKNNAANWTGYTYHHRKPGATSPGGGGTSHSPTQGLEEDELGANHKASMVRPLARLDAKKAKYRQQKEMSGRGQRGKKAFVSVGDDVEYPEEGMLGTPLKCKSGYLQEREEMMAEYGPFGISGLVMGEELGV